MRRFISDLSLAIVILIFFAAFVTFWNAATNTGSMML